MIKIKRIYAEPDKEDGYRMLVDRLWPRGISKVAAQLDEWNKDIAPSTTLRRWYGHKPDLFEEFVLLYKHELLEKTAELYRIKKLGEVGTLTLLYGAKDEKRNQAIVLREVIKGLEEK